MPLTAVSHVLRASSGSPDSTKSRPSSFAMSRCETSVAMLTAVNASVACYRKAPNSRQFFESHADSGDVVFYVHQDGDDPEMPKEA